MPEVRAIRSSRLLAAKAAISSAVGGGRRGDLLEMCILTLWTGPSSVVSMRASSAARKLSEALSR